LYNFKTTKRIDDGIQRLDEIRAELDSREPGPDAWQARMRRDFEAEAIAGSLALARVTVSVDDARRVLVGDRPTSVGVEAAELVAGFAAGMRLALKAAEARDFHWNSELLCSVHKHVLAESAEQGAGHLRDNQEWVTNRWKGIDVYLPPAADVVPGLLGETMAWLDSADIPAPIAASLAHVSIAGIHPFADGNGRAARIMAATAMHGGGYCHPLFASLDAWWGRHADAHHHAFDCLGTGWDPDTDVTTFIEAHVKAQVAHAEVLSARTIAEQALWVVLRYTAVEDLSLNERATNALYDAFFARDVTNRYYCGLTGVTEEMASVDLAKLLASGLIMTRGAGAAARYIASPTLFECTIHNAGLDPKWLLPSGSAGKRRDAVLSALASGGETTADVRG
jgi:Fic family protein